MSESFVNNDFLFFVPYVFNSQGRDFVVIIVYSVLADSVCCLRTLRPWVAYTVR